MVEALVADGAHESLGESVRTGRADRGANRQASPIRVQNVALGVAPSAGSMRTFRLTSSTFPAIVVFVPGLDEEARCE